MVDDESKKAKSSINRRDALKVISTVPAVLVPLAPAAAQEAKRQVRPPAAETAGEYKRQTFDEHEWKTVRLLSDTIIPRDERSGSATDAGVPEFIDDWLAMRGGEALAAVRGGLIWLDLECQRAYARDFSDSTADQQKQMLDRIAYPKTAAPADAAGVTFFNHLRDLVVSGFFSSKMGIQDLPYLGNQMLAEWPGCPAEVLEKIHRNEEKTRST